MHEWFVYPDHERASQAAADFLAEKIKHTIDTKGVCHVVLPGGNTPVMCLGYLSKNDLPWEKVHWYPGDERCYPPGHAERNDQMLQEVLWSRIGKTNVHSIPAELGAEDAAAQFRDEIAGIERFDIAFLGLGEDGHTASLFPGNAALDDARSVVPIFNSPKPPSDRVTISLSMLSKTRCKVILVSGAGKAHIVRRIKAGDKLPVNSIGDISWIIDEAADMLK